MSFLLVGIGGAFGAVTRFSLGRFISSKSGSAFPVSTFFINISGAFLLGVLTGSGKSGGLYILLGDGFLGAFTTFSTFMYEGFRLFKDNDRLNAYTYILASFILGILFFFLGFAFAGFLKH